MAIAFVQSNTVADGGAGTSLSCPFLSDNTAGNFIVAVAGTTNTGAESISVSDAQGNLYQSTDEIRVPLGFVAGQLFYAANIKAGANTVTVTQNGTNSATGPGNIEDSGPLTTTNANDLLVGYFAGSAVDPGSDAPGAGWIGTVRSGASICICAEYQIVSVSGTYNATFTSSGPKAGGNAWAAMIVAFSGSGAGPISSSPCGMLMGVGV